MILFCPSPVSPYLWVGLTGQVNNIENRFKWQGKESLELFGLSNIIDNNARYVDKTINRWWGVDALIDQKRRFSPYTVNFNNPLRFIDHDGNEAQEVKDFTYTDGYGTYSSRNSSGSVGFSGAYENTFGDDKPKPKTPQTNNNSKDTKTGQNNNTTTAQNNQTNTKCTECLDPSTVGQNLMGLSYPGGNNPLSYNRKYNYSYVPTDISEYPAIGHDRRYDNLKTEGLAGLLKDTRAIGADWQFVKEELSIASLPFSPMQRLHAFGLGVGLGLLALPKTVLKLSTPTGFAEALLWHKVSSIGVDNKPTKSK